MNRASVFVVVLLLGLAPDAWAKQTGASRRPAAREGARAAPAPKPSAAPEDKEAEAVGGLALGDRPWAQGVSQERQDAADKHFKAGNALLKESVFVKAVDEYRKALGYWDHPGIHYNMALALLNMDQPLEVYQHLQQATQYGAAPLDPEKLEHARAYRSLVEKALARVEITCEEPGASVVMDGRLLFTAPGRYEGLVRAGPHSIVATKEGFFTNDLSRPLPAGEKTTLAIKLYTSDDLVRYRRRWSAWKPWSLLGAGVAVAAGGGLLHMQARNSYVQFDEGIRACGGCIPQPDLADLRGRGDLLQGVAFGSYALGGLTMVAGAVLVYLNQPEAYSINVDEAKQEVSVVPVLGGGAGGVSATFRF